MSTKPLRVRHLCARGIQKTQPPSCNILLRVILKHSYASTLRHWPCGPEDLASSPAATKKPKTNPKQWPQQPASSFQTCRSTCSGKARWQPLQLLQLPPSAPLPRFHSEWRRSARARGLGGPPELPGPGPAALGFGLSRRPTSKHASGGTTRPVSWAFQGLPETSLSCEKPQPAAAPCEGRAGLRKGSDRAAACLQKYQSRTGPERRHATGLGDPPPQCRPAYPLAGAHQTSTSEHSDPALRTRLASLELSQRLASLVDPRRRPAS